MSYAMSESRQKSYAAARSALAQYYIKSTELVGMKGLEPSRLAARAPKARVYTNFTTSPSLFFTVMHEIRLALFYINVRQLPI